MPSRKEFLVLYIGATDRSFGQRLKEHHEDLQKKDKDKATRWQRILEGVELGQLRAICHPCNYPFFFERVLLQSRYFTTLLNVEFIHKQDILWADAEKQGSVTQMDYNFVVKNLFASFEKAEEPLQKAQQAVISGIVDTVEKK